MISMRIGKQGIPLWFRCFKSKNNSEAFKVNIIKEGISYVSNLFGDGFDLIFLADRWFNSTKLMEHINSLASNTPWIISTNGDPRRAVKDYSYIFGGIESLFKNQKSNGFSLESSVNCSLKYFSSMYSLVCFSTLFLTIFGADYTKNSKCYKKVKLTTHKRFKDGSVKRVLSLFNIGLTLFKLAYNSSRYIRVPYNFILYDL